MPFTLTMPKLSPTMEEGTIVKWHKAVGEQVKAGDLLLDVATDKATVEHSAIDSGWLRQIIISEGKSAIVNQAIAVLTEDKNEKIEGYVPQGSTPAQPKAKAEAVDPIKEASKKSSEVKSAGEATLKQPSFVPEAPLTDYKFALPSDLAETRIVASPLARKLAKEKGLDLSTVKGTGPGERIVSDDLERAQATGLVTFGRREAPQIVPGTYEEETLSPMRKVIAQRLQESKSFIPHFYVQQAIDVKALVATREQLANSDVKVSVNDLVLRACALALRQHPEVNSGFNSLEQKIIRFKTIDLSVAVSVNEGLITPIIRHADYKNVGELSVEMRSLAKRAKEGKLEAHEYKGGSFTVSNLGMFGITDFQAIINPPQGAILAVSAIQEAPVVKEGVVSVGQVMNVSLSVDHRVIDGVAAARFIKTLQKLLENPASLLI
ncbi:MAG: pyruvate dehydrogenase complex dihydrolipoamide acetyltransferase [Parachlamydiaceae bacterium]|nr:pyruvate dehydrogenase complex dihydrolipoamide acetyltransferase [Parachlamydiaceae bacterium]